MPPKSWLDRSAERAADACVEHTWYARSWNHYLEKTNRTAAQCVLSDNLRLLSRRADSVTDPRLIPPQLGYGNVVARNDVVGRAVPGRDGHLGVGLRG